MDYGFANRDLISKGLVSRFTSNAAKGVREQAELGAKNTSQVAEDTVKRITSNTEKRTFPIALKAGAGLGAGFGTTGAAAAVGGSAANRKLKKIQSRGKQQ